MTFSYYPLSVIVVFSFMSSLIFIPNAMHLLFKMFNVILVVRNAFFALSIFHSASSFSLSFVEILLSYLFIILFFVLLQIFLLLFPFFYASCNGNLVRFFFFLFNCFCWRSRYHFKLKCNRNQNTKKRSVRVDGKKLKNTRIILCKRLLQKKNLTPG